MKHCKNCNKNVVPVTPKFKWYDWLCFCIGLMCVGVGALIFVIIRNIIVSKRCPICGCKI